MTTSTAPAPPAAPTADLAAYLARIGVPHGPPDLALLTRIVGAHVATIPFENLDPFTGAEPPVDRAGVVAKLVHGRRGGWCFEQNLLLDEMLRDLGYRVTALAGRMRLGLDDDAPATSRNHRLALVRTGDGSVTADVGLGGTGPTEPLRLVTGGVQPTAHAAYRYTRDGAGNWFLQRRGSGDWTTQYAFDLVPAPDADFAMGSWYLTHHPGSGFRDGLSVAHTGADRRVTLSGTRYTVRHLGGRTERHDLTSPGAVLNVLEDRFGIDTSGVAGLESRIADAYFG